MSRFSNLSGENHTDLRQALGIYAVRVPLGTANARRGPTDSRDLPSNPSSISMTSERVIGFVGMARHRCHLFALSLDENRESSGLARPCYIRQEINLRSEAIFKQARV